MQIAHSTALNIKYIFINIFIVNLFIFQITHAIILELLFLIKFRLQIVAIKIEFNSNRLYYKSSSFSILFIFYSSFYKHDFIDLPLKLLNIRYFVIFSIFFCAVQKLINFLDMFIRI